MSPKDLHVRYLALARIGRRQVGAQDAASTQEYHCASRMSNPAASSVGAGAHASGLERIGALKEDRRRDEVVREWLAFPEPPQPTLK